MWKPWCPTQSGAKWWRKICSGRQCAVQLCPWLCLRWSCDTHMHHQCRKCRRLGLSRSHLSRYGLHVFLCCACAGACLCVCMTRCEEFLSNLKINSKSTSIFKILLLYMCQMKWKKKKLKMFKKTQAIFKITEMLTSMWNFMGKKALHIFMCTVFKCP